VKAIKKLNGDGITKCIVLHKDSGAYNIFTPREAAQAIIALSKILWIGIPLHKNNRND
jgi:hypothetical protein